MRLLVLSVLLAISLAATHITKGFTLSPEGFPASWNAMLPFFVQVCRSSQAPQPHMLTTHSQVAGYPNSSVTQNGPWRDNITTSGQPPSAAVVVAQISKDFRITPIQVFGWRISDSTPILNTPTNPVNNWSNMDAQQLYLEAIVAFVTQYEAPYIFLGNENDFYYAANATDYAIWITVYNQVVDAVRAANPNAKVGPCFNFEHLSGNGHINGWSESYWPALLMHDFSRVDVLGLSVYPFFNYTAASNVPSAYLDELLANIPANTDIIITETGWPAESYPTLPIPWQASTASQVDYVASLYALDAFIQARIEAATWLFLYQEQGTGASVAEFGSISMYDENGVVRPALDAWLLA